MGKGKAATKLNSDGRVMVSSRGAQVSRWTTTSSKAEYSSASRAKLSKRFTEKQTIMVRTIPGARIEDALA
jgi:hypothetical protein